MLPAFKSGTRSRSGSPATSETIPFAAAAASDGRAIALLNQLKAQLDALAGSATDVTALNAVSDSLDAGTAALDAAVVANTPA